MNKKFYYLLSALGFIGFICLCIIIFTSAKNVNKKIPNVTPTITPYDQSAAKQFKGNAKPGVDVKLNPTEAEIDRKSSLVGKLLEQLPYSGSNFSLSFDYEENSFTVYLSANNLTQANSEFDNFLKTNGVENKDWIDNLKTIYTRPTIVP